MGTVNASPQAKTVADPSAIYDSMRPLWEKSRAAIGGERLVKDYDQLLDTAAFTNLLLPFSTSMDQQQYDFYKAEAEWPGIVSQYARILIGGLLRKQPSLKLPEGIPADAHGWIMSQFTQDNSSLISFLDDMLWEEVQTSGPWLYVAYPKVENAGDLTKEESLALKPYPIIWKAESVINWRTVQKSDGSQAFDRIIVRNYEEEYLEDSFHPSYVDTVTVHELVEGRYQIRKFQFKGPAIGAQAANGVIKQEYGPNTPKGVFELVETITEIQMDGEYLSEIPAWPFNGSTKCVDPMLTPLIDREVALYNKISRRNHLLYGAATYTPWIASDMDEGEFKRVVAGGLGTWIRLLKDDKIGVLETPTAALADMDRAIAATLDEMAKLGIRMLTPDTDQSGIALQIRNAAQTSQLGTLNTKISAVMADVIAFMLNWRYRLKLTASDVKFELSADFSPVPIGADFIRLLTEFYEKGLLPRSEWLSSLKANDLLTPEYNDEVGKVEIVQDGLITTPQENVDYQKQIQAMAGLQGSTDPSVQQFIANKLVQDMIKP